MKLRVLTETARAVATGVTNLALGRGGHSLLTLRSGDPAPDFRLSASDGRDYTLSEFLGRKYVVIAWFPKAFTGGCTVECRSLGVHRALINRTSVQFFAASVDAVATNAEFAVALDLAYPILSDPSRGVARRTVYWVRAVSRYAGRSILVSMAAFSTLTSTSARRRTATTWPRG